MQRIRSIRKRIRSYRQSFCYEKERFLKCKKKITLTTETLYFIGKIVKKETNLPHLIIDNTHAEKYNLDDNEGGLLK